MKMLYMIPHSQRLTRRPASTCMLILALGVIAPGTALGWSGVIGNPNNFADVFPNIPGDPLQDGTLVLTVTPGINRATEALGVCFGFGCRDDFDSFRMEVPLNLRITLTDFRVPNTDGTVVQIFIFATDGIAIIDPVNDPNFAAGALFGLTANISTSPVLSSVVLGPGLYDVVAAKCCGAGVWDVRFTAIEIPTAQCAGDADGSGEVNFADITNVLGNWLNDYTPGTGPGDANGDGIVNFADITAVLGNWLVVCP